MLRRTVVQCQRGVRSGGDARRYLKTSIADLRKGDWIEHEGKVVVVHQVNSAFSGRGARNYLMMVKDPIGETMTAVKPSARDFFEKLELSDVAHQYLYSADDMLYLLNPATLEEIAVSAHLVGGHLARLLEGGTEVKVRMRGDTPIFVHSAHRNYTCTVTAVLERREGTDRKTTVVEVQGGARVLCHAAVEVGDRIIVAVDDLSFQGRPLITNKSI